MLLNISNFVVLSTHGVLIVPECICLPECLLLSGFLAVNHALLLWVASDGKHTRTRIHTGTCARTKTHVGVQAVAQRPHPPLAGPSAYALLITSPFIPNAMRPLSELENNRAALNCTATEQASSPTSSAII